MDDTRSGGDQSPEQHLTRSSSAPEIDRGTDASSLEPGGPGDRGVERGEAGLDPATTTSDDAEAMVVPEAIEGGALEIEDLTTDPAAPDDPDV